MRPGIDIAKTRRWLMLLLCATGLIVTAFVFEDAIPADDEAPARAQEGAATEESAGDEEVIVCKHADNFQQDQATGLTILTGNVQIDRPDGFLNADKVTIRRDVETGEALDTVAEGNVELRDGDIFATCIHAVLNHVTDIVELRDNVVVKQNEDHLEADFFTFDRRTGKRVGKGNIRFRVRLTPKKEPENSPNS